MAQPKSQFEVLTDLSEKLNAAKVARDDASDNVRSAEDDLKHAQAVLSSREQQLKTAREAYQKELEA